MMNRFFKAGAFALVAAVIAGLPVWLEAQTNQNAAAATQAPGEKKEAPAKKRAAGPFRGKLAAVDKVAKTITVGKRTFQITSTTRIFKGGAPATLDDGVVGERVTGGFRTAEDGKLNATKVTFGPKTEGKGAARKADAKGGGY
jgi:hypothetical protein